MAEKLNHEIHERHEIRKGKRLFNPNCEVGDDTACERGKQVGMPQAARVKRSKPLGRVAEKLPKANPKGVTAPGCAKAQAIS